MKQLRNNQQWLTDLRGQNGVDAQQRAHLELANYLYVVAYNYLLGRQNDVAALTNYAPEDLALLAQDCIQDLLEKFARDDFAQLAKYRAEGPFTAWATQCMRNHIAGMVRRAPFRHEYIDLDALFDLTTEEPAQSERLVQTEVIQTLRECLNQLADHYREALVRCIMDGEAAKIVAEALGRSEGAVHLLVMRAKRQVAKCLGGKGIGPEVLGLF